MIGSQVRRRPTSRAVFPPLLHLPLMLLPLLLLPLLLFVSSGCRGKPPKPLALGLHPMKVAGHEVVVEIAADPASRRTGLMNRPSLGEDHGMLFIFPQPQMQSFYMRNCLIDLDIAYIDDEGKIVDILRMVAPDPTASTWPRYKSSVPVRYALETNAGWFEAHGVGVGDVVEGYRGARDTRVR